jgi:hypothetical protein
MSECFSALLCLPLGSSIATPLCEQSCMTTNRMRESRSCGSVRAEGSNVLGYSEVSSWPKENSPSHRAEFLCACVGGGLERHRTAAEQEQSVTLGRPEAAGCGSVN